MNCGGAGKGDAIFTSVSPGISVDSFDVGTIPGSGTFFCAACGSQLSLRENDRLPECPRCGAAEFQRDSIFESMQEHGQTAEFDGRRDRLDARAGCDEARAMLPRARPLPGLPRRRRRDPRLPDRAGLDADRPQRRRRHPPRRPQRLPPPRPDRLRAARSRCACSTTAASTASSSTARSSSGARLADGDELAIGRYRLFALEALNSAQFPATGARSMGAVDVPTPAIPDPEVAAERARERLHEEIERVRSGVEEMLAEQEQRRRRDRPAPRTRRDPRRDQLPAQAPRAQDGEAPQQADQQDRRPHRGPGAAPRPGRAGPQVRRVADPHQHRGRCSTACSQEIRAIADLLTRR